MRVTILFPVFAFALLLSCSSDNNNDNNECTAKVFELESICDVSSCSFDVVYGTSETTTTTVSVSEATYNYYLNDFIPGETCWEGTQPE